MINTAYITPAFQKLSPNEELPYALGIVEAGLMQGKLTASDFSDETRAVLDLQPARLIASSQAPKLLGISRTTFRKNVEM